MTTRGEQEIVESGYIVSGLGVVKTDYTCNLFLYHTSITGGFPELMADMNAMSFSLECLLVISEKSLFGRELSQHFLQTELLFPCYRDFSLLGDSVNP